MSHLVRVVCPNGTLISQKNSAELAGLSDGSLVIFCQTVDFDLPFEATFEFLHLVISQSL